jgi:membrane protein insertase Oxa1/YidC/SpoIIIJ
LSSQNIALAIISGILIYAQTRMTGLIQPKMQTQEVNGQQMPDMSKMMPMMNIMMSVMMVSFVYQVKN